MPSDSNGVHALTAGYLGVGGETILPSNHNPPLEDISAGLTARLMRSGAGGMTGQFKAADGTVGAPGVTFGSALSTGFYKTTGGFGVAVAGALVAEFGAGGILSGVVTAGIADKAVTLAKLYHPSGPSKLLGTDSNAALTITGAASNGGPNLIRLTVASTATFATSQKKTVSDVLGTTEANATWTITVIDGTHIDLQGSVFTNAYVSGGTIGGGVEEIVLGSGLTLTGDTLSATVSGLLGYISGLLLSTAGSSSTFAVGIGVATDASGGGLMAIASSISKTTASWAVGSGNGALDTGSVAINTWYHVYQIKRVDTGVVDVLFSLSATTPTMPTNYTLKRRIGAMRTNASSQWTMFIQIRDEFVWQVPVGDVASQALTTTPTLETLTVPTGLNVLARFNTEYISTLNSSSFTVYSDLIASQAVGSPLGNLNGSTQAVNMRAASSSHEVMTNTSAQIRAVSNGQGTIQFSITTIGWRDDRGQ